MTEAYKSAKVLTAYYDRLAGALAGLEPCVKIAKFSFGHGYVDETNLTPEGWPSFLPIPDDLADIPGIFFEGVPEMVKADGRVLIRCYMPFGSVAAPEKYSLTGLYDEQNNLLAVMQGLPGWLEPDKSRTTFGYLDFPHLGDNPPTGF